MHRLLILVTIGLLAGQPSPLRAQTAQQPNSAAAPAAAASDDMLPIVIGLGAIAGVVTFNVLALGLEALPGGLAYGGAATVPAEISVAVSRVYATVSAVIGGWLANYAYTQ
jgi:hypothetical protein